MVKNNKLKDDYLVDRYIRNLEENYDDVIEKLNDEINVLINENKIITNENKRLIEENKQYKKENKHFKSSKAYKIWKKYALLKDDPNFDEDFIKTGNEKSSLVLKSIDDAESDREIFTNLKKPDEIKVVFIADQFTFDSFKYEFDYILITPDNWLERFETEKPDLFFCESAWIGYYPNNSFEPWRRKILRDGHSKEENRNVLFDVLEYCNEHDIPTVFWNKEDPVSYVDEISSFGDTASRFDYIFTSSKECIPQYEKDFNHPEVHHLMFAGQPKLFNPLKFNDETIEDIVFTGSYYVGFNQRIKDIDLIFSLLEENDLPFRIYDRQYYNDTPNKFPDEFKKNVLPAVDYNEIPNLYKMLKFGININTITDSETMFARRVFELALSFTNIISNYSIGVDKIFSNNVFYFDKGELPLINEDYTEKRLNNLYTVLENHTYHDRWIEILDTIGFDYTEEKDDVSVIFEVGGG